MGSSKNSRSARRAFVGVASLLMVGAFVGPGPTTNVAEAAAPAVASVGSAAPRNFALGAASRQSSLTAEADLVGDPKRAVDGYDSRITTTARQINPYVEIDLGGSRFLTELKLWGVKSDRDDFWVFLSAKPLTSDDPNVVAADPNVTAMHFDSAPGVLPIPVQSMARYMRIQGKGVLTVAEVAAYGPDGFENFAAFGTATQSSTSYGGSPEMAIDGDAAGKHRGGSVSHTASELRPWWQIDLGVQRTVSEIRVWNRTDCCSERLSDFYVYASDRPFPTNDPAVLATDPNVVATRITTRPDPMVSIPLNRTARYVRVQLAGSNFLSLAEVEVVGPTPRNYAAGGVATQSSTSYGGLAEYAQDNNRTGKHHDHTVSHTGYEVRPWWQVDLGKPQRLNEIRVWNRTDCCSERLSDFYVYASDQPFASNDPAVLAQDPNVTTTRVTSQPTPVVSIPLDRTARFVRVQLASTNYLSLAEVEVLGPEVLQRPDSQGWINRHEFGMFIHYGMSTADNQQWAKPNTSPSKFNPGVAKVDTDQWITAAKSAGMDYAVLTAKHHDGFALWPTKYSDYSVASSPYDGDIVRDYVQSARDGGLKPGLYFSIWDRTNGQTTQLVKNQLRELLTNYGEIDYLWFDGYGRRIWFTEVSWNDLRDFIHQVSPNTIVAANDHRNDPTSSDILLDEFTRPVWGGTKTDLPVEVAQPMDVGSRTWFYTTATGDPLSADIINQNRQVMASENTTYLLNVGPRLDGTLDSRYVDRLREVGRFTPG